MAQKTYKRKRTSKRRVKPSMKKMVEKIVKKNIETKHLDVQIPVMTAGNNSTIVPLTNVVQGDDFSARTGRRIQLDSVTCHLACNQYSSSCYVALVLDRQPNGTAPVLSDIYNTGTYPTTNLNATVLKNVAKNELRFKILWEQTFPDCSTEVPITTGNVLTAMKKYYKFRGGRDSQTEFGDTAASVPITNGVFLVWVGYWAPTNSPQVNLSGLCRLAFKDA